MSPYCSDLLCVFMVPNVRMSLCCFPISGKIHEIKYGIRIGGEMKRTHLALLWAALAFTGTGFAQNLSSQFVIGGETARKIHDFTTINLATAERIAETCERLAQKEGGQSTSSTPMGLLCIRNAATARSIPTSTRPC